jgi:chromosome segregation ATPase
MDLAWIVILTIAGIFAVGMVAGFAVLFRRGSVAGPALHASRSGAPIASPDPVGAATQRANILLVRADDAVRDAADELDFAIAQFGADRTRALAEAIDAARRDVMTAFELQQRLDDHIPDSEAQRRDWTARIVHLCETAQAALATQLRTIDSLREVERNAPDTLAKLRRLVDATSTRETTVAAVHSELQRRYSVPAIASVADSVDRASAELDAAREAIDTAALTVDPGDGPSGPRAAIDAIDALREGDEHVRRAGHLLDAVETLRSQLAAADAALDATIESTEDSLAEARALRDGATDATTGASVLDAIAVVESTLTTLDRRHPVDALERLREANQQLDGAMATVRNQERRLQHAREALVGALVAARSQVSSTRDYVEGRRGGIGRAARTRLAEAERLLTVAEAEADPVLALDTARSAATHARDADALARYDIQH